MLHRRQLPIVSHCDDFVGREATDDQPGFCTHCAKDVHDLSRMTESEVIDLIARTGGDVCVSYRVRDDGLIELRRPRPRLAPVGFALALTGCAGHLDATAQQADVAMGSREGCPRPDAPKPGHRYAVDSTELDAAVAAGPSDAPLIPSRPTTAVAEAPTHAEPGQPTEPPAIPVQDETASYEEPPASCVVTERMRRMAEAHRRFERGKLAPLTDAYLCADPRVVKAEARRQRREARRRR